MIFNKKLIELKGEDGLIVIKRDPHGIPEVSAESFPDLSYGMGWVHANDRLLQMILARIILQGRSSEFFKAKPEYIEVDKYIRRMNFFPDIDKEIKKLYPEVKKNLLSYTNGINKFLKNNRNIVELQFLGIKPESWDIKDTMMMSKLFGFFGLADTQASIKRLIIKMIQKDLDEKKIRELFPFLTDKIDSKLIKKIILNPELTSGAMAWLSKLPKISSGNSWVVSGNITESGSPILCGSPHLQVNRLPSVWSEIILRLPGETFLGASIPGVPVIFTGRNKKISWSLDSSSMDMIDYRIEECKDGKYKRNNRWLPFNVREEHILVKNEESITEYIYENSTGLLEGNPNVSGCYLSMKWSGSDNCGGNDLNGLFGVMTSKSVREAMNYYKLLDAASFNFVIADRKGNIGMQTSGRIFNRAKGVSGLLPQPAWDRKYDYSGYIKKSRLPSIYNPKDGIIITDNQNIVNFTNINIINISKPSYRFNIITNLLEKRNKLSIEYMKDIQYNHYSVQAEKFMKILRPLLPDTKNGKILKEWSCIYTDDSKGASIFENIYITLLKIIFGENGIGVDSIKYLINEISIFNNYYENFDDILLKEKSPWFDGERREMLFNIAITEALRLKVKPYGKTRKIIISHLLFGGKFSGAFSNNNISLSGNRSTIDHGEIFKNKKRTIVLGPSYRIIADMNSDEIESNLPGGPSDRKFSKLYRNDFKNWKDGEYKILK